MSLQRIISQDDVPQLVLAVTSITAGIHANPVACQAISRDCAISGRSFVEEIAVIAVDQAAANAAEIARRFVVTVGG